MAERRHRALSGGRARRGRGPAARHRRCGAGHPGVARRPVVHRRRHPEPGRRSRPNWTRAHWSAGTSPWHGSRFDGHPTTVYTRSRPAPVEAVRAVLAATANPEAPNEIQVSPPVGRAGRPARHRQRVHRAAARPGAVSRCWSAGSGWPTRWSSRSSNGVPRSACAARSAPRGDRSASSSSPSRCCWPPSAASAASPWASRSPRCYASTQAWPTVVPPWAVAGGVAATLVIGGVAGLYPAIRAARLSPTEALASP